MEKVSIIIPAYNEETVLAETLQTLRSAYWAHEIIVVNDGSSDGTERIANLYSDKTITLQTNVGKGKALQKGWGVASGDILMTLDADLGNSVSEGNKLLEPIQYSDYDFTIAKFPVGKKSGFGLMKKRVQKLIWNKTGQWIAAPLSGQRAFKRKWLSVVLERSYYRFAVETLMTIDLLQAGAKVCEIDTTMSHRYTGKDIKGFVHRGAQWLQMEKAVRGLR